MNENFINKDTNNINTNEKLNLQSCCICLEEQTEFDIENDNKLIEYNHCGSYYVHNKCLNNWKSNECLICRKNFNENNNCNNNNNSNDNNTDNDSDNDIITILIEPNNGNTQCQKFCVNFCFLINFFGIGTYFFYQYYY
jgi:hypothetical protein